MSISNNYNYKNLDYATLTLVIIIVKLGKRISKEI
jgi:hypothetical protein